MGANLIGTIIAGPDCIDPELRAKVIKDVQASLQDCITNCSVGPDEENFFCMPEEEIMGLETSEIHKRVTEAVDNFLAVWNEDTHPRDVMWRHIDVGGTRMKVMTSGDLSWGDEPDGLGYRTLTEAARAGIHTAFGCQ